MAAHSITQCETRKRITDALRPSDPIILGSLSSCSAIAEKDVYPAALDTGRGDGGTELANPSADHLFAQEYVAEAHALGRNASYFPKSRSTSRFPNSLRFGTGKPCFITVTSI